MSPTYIPHSKNRVEADTIKSNFFYALDRRGPKSIKTVSRGAYSTDYGDFMDSSTKRAEDIYCILSFKQISIWTTEKNEWKTWKKVECWKPGSRSIMEFLNKLFWVELYGEENANDEHSEMNVIEWPKSRKLAKKNKWSGVECGKHHQDETVNSFWQYVHFKRGSCRPNQVHLKHILREKRTCYEVENMQIMPDVKGVKFYFAASILLVQMGFSLLAPNSPLG